MKLYLPDVTLVAPTGNNIEKTIESIQISCDKVDFGAVKLITHNKLDNHPDFIKFEESEYPMNTYTKYNEYVFLNLGKHVNTSHCLLVQYDSWILNADVWDNDWLQYDYCGAPWPKVENSYMANNGDRVNVGNGGFSLRSKKLCDLPFKMNWNLKQEQSFFNEDGNICCYWRREMLENGIKYAPVEVAAKFSYENPIIENNFGKMKTFGFHKNLPKGM